MKDCYMIVSLIAVIDVSAHAVAASFCVHNGIVRGFRWLSNSRLVSFSYTQVCEFIPLFSITWLIQRWTQRWIHGVYRVALVSPLVIEENGAFHFKTHLTMETEKEMQKFTAKIVDMMKQEKLYASQGGPIILSLVGLVFFILKGENLRLAGGNWNYYDALRPEKRGPKLEATHLEKAKELYTKLRIGTSFYGAVSLLGFSAMFSAILLAHESIYGQMAAYMKESGEGSEGTAKWLLNEIARRETDAERSLMHR
ncbi:hypothetical protein Syun_008880 [Stephania yunnanensis]|uniref:WDR11 second beta-propeller domain-containing protein n=1 Tax=Stephania yunnanensis TaxID=152371 RepID=A0AAP0KDE6_9MAGN